VGFDFYSFCCPNLVKIIFRNFKNIHLELAFAFRI
jgi:hypothetical protein